MHAFEAEKLLSQIMMAVVKASAASSSSVWMSSGFSSSCTKACASSMVWKKPVSVFVMEARILSMDLVL